MKHKTKPDNLEYDVWNISKQFTIEKILRFLVWFDVYELIARFGTQVSSDEIPEELVPFKRKEGIHRCIHSLYLLLSNSKVVIPRRKMKFYKEEINFINQQLPKTYSIKYDSILKKRSIVIHEKNFDLLLKYARNLYEAILTELKKSGVLAWQKDDFNMDAIFEDFVKKA